MPAGEEAVLAAVERRRELVDEAVPEELPTRHPERLWEAARHLLDAGGKRLRPTVVLLAGEALVDVDADADADGADGGDADGTADGDADGGDADGARGTADGGNADGADGAGGIDYRAFPALDGGTVDLLRAAVAIEIVHTFTLIHDDIMDDDPLRRGVAAVHEAYDEETAIIAGDTLYSVAFELMLDTGAPPGRRLEALDLLAETCTRICEGQALDVGFETRPDVLPEEYLEMIDHKTAVLYGAAAAIPAVLLGGADGTTEALYGFGREVGRAFQIHDDVLDLTAPSERLGKQRGSDLIEGKRTIITVHARERGVDVDGLVDADDPAAVSEAEVDAAVAELEAAGSIEYARERARELAESGKDRLDALPDNEARELLAGIADYLVEREY